jgi:hypothetical protein
MPRFLIPEKGRALRTNKGEATDIDVVVIDRQCGTLVLSQLKWQEMFGKAPRERRSRASNFLQEGGKWIHIVREWIAGRTGRDIARSLSIPEWQHASEAPPLLFVVGRYAANFTTEQPYYDGAAWCSWLELQKQVDRAHLTLISRHFTRLSFSVPLRSRD